VAERLFVYSPGERLVTMTAAGVAVLFEVAEDGSITPVRDVSRAEPERFQVEAMHLDNGEQEALCDPTLDCSITRHMDDVTCDPCRRRAAENFTREQQASRKGQDGPTVAP
jgi:hypothetical protein